MIARAARVGGCLWGLVMLLNRLAERAALGRLLEAARGGRSAVLLVRGEPGVGKTALLEDAVQAAAGFRVARAVGVESEMELAFAVLHQLCAPMLDQLERLPPPQQDALAVAADDPGSVCQGLAGQWQRGRVEKHRSPSVADADLGRSLHLPGASLCAKATRRT